jgi:hypothetical protein
MTKTTMSPIAIAPVTTTGVPQGLAKTAHGTIRSRATNRVASLLCKYPIGERYKTILDLTQILLAA